MGYFKKAKFTASDSREKFWIFTSTIYKKGKDVVFVKGKTKDFIKGRRT